MEIEIKKYVLEQLNGQCIRRKRIDVLEFELEALMSQADEKQEKLLRRWRSLMETVNMYRPVISLTSRLISRWVTARKSPIKRGNYMRG